MAMRNLIILAALALALTLTACGTDQARPTTPGEHVIFKDRFVEVQKPCPVTKPVRPAPLARPLPADPGALVSLLTSKLLEWAGPGGYGESADSKLDTCLKPKEPPK
jgi:hypothetical protein